MLWISHEWTGTSYNQNPLSNTTKYACLLFLFVSLTFCIFLLYVTSKSYGPRAFLLRICLQTLRYKDIDQISNFHSTSAPPAVISYLMMLSWPASLHPHLYWLNMAGFLDRKNYIYLPYDLISLHLYSSIFRSIN